MLRNGSLDDGDLVVKKNRPARVWKSEPYRALTFVFSVSAFSVLSLRDVRCSMIMKEEQSSKRSLAHEQRAQRCCSSDAQLAAMIRDKRRNGSPSADCAPHLQPQI